MDKPGFDDLCKLWKKHDPDKEGPDVLLSEKDWEFVLETKQMRNDLVQGRRVFSLSKCKARSKRIVRILKRLRDEYADTYFLDPWKKLTSAENAPKAKSGH